MVRDTQTAQIHLRLISALVKKLMSEGYSVSADHIGYPNGKPPKINEYVPDIYAKKGQKILIVEAETCDSLNTVDTKLQWIAFSSQEDASFSVIVPKKCITEAKKLAKQWGVNVKEFWTMEI